MNNKLKDILLAAGLLIGLFGTPLSIHYFYEEYGGWTVAIPLACAALFFGIRAFLSSGGGNHR